MKSKLFIFAFILVGLIFFPIIQAEPELNNTIPFSLLEIEDVKARFTLMENLSKTSNISILDTTTFQRETFEWDSPSCEGGGTIAENPSDDFECSWYYDENVVTTLTKIKRTFETNWGASAANWEGPLTGWSEFYLKLQVRKA